MSVIKPRTRGKGLVKHDLQLDEQNQETLYAYAHFLGESTEYVLTQLIDTVLAKDKDLSGGERTIRSPMSRAQWSSARVSRLARNRPPRTTRGINRRAVGLVTRMPTLPRGRVNPGGVDNIARQCLRSPRRQPSSSAP